MNIVIQGAGRGIGLALAKRALREMADANGDIPADSHLFLTARTPSTSDGYSALPAGPNITWLSVDFTNEQSIGDAGATICGRTDKIDRMICTAGVLFDERTKPEKHIAELNSQSLLYSYQINAVGPLLFTKSLWPALRGKHAAVIASLSARVGSISDNRLGGWYSYRASKAAQNQLMHTMAIELARVNPAALVAMLHPGTVDTNLSKMFQRGVPEGKLFTADYSADCLWRVLDGLTPTDSGGFFAYDGSPIGF